MLFRSQGKTYSCPGGTNKEMQDSRRQMYRYIRLTYLIPELLQLVDDKLLKDKNLFLTMGIKPAVELSYLTKDEQKLVYSEIVYENLTPSHAQAIRIKNLSKDKKLNDEVLENILNENKGNQNEKISFNKEKIISSLPKEIIKRDKRYIEEYIVKAIEKYKNLDNNKQNSMELN